MIVITLDYLISWLCFGGLILLLLHVGIAFFRASKGNFNRDFLIGIALFMIIFALSTTFWLINDALNYVSFENSSLDYFRYWRLSNVSIFLSLFILIFSIEKHIIKKTHYILSILVLSNIPIFLFAPWNIDQSTTISFSIMRFKSPFSLFWSYYFVLALNLGILALVLLYFYMVIQQTGDVRKRSILLTLGIFALWLGRMTAYREIDPLFLSESLQMILGPIVMIIGVYCLYLGYWEQLHGEKEKLITNSD